MENSNLFTQLILIGIIVVIWLIARLLSRFKAFEQRLYNIELFLFNESRRDMETATTPYGEPDIRTNQDTAEESGMPDTPAHYIHEDQEYLSHTDVQEENDCSTLPLNIPPIPTATTAPAILPEQEESPYNDDTVESDISDYDTECTPEHNTGTHRNRNNIERQIGVNLFSKIGILVLIIGIGFFVKYAIDNNWINETARALLGIATGLGLWGIAYRLRESYRNFSSVLAGGGFAVCFVTIAIAHNVYALINPLATMCSLVALTVTMIVISLVFDRRELAMTAIIGGFIAPFIASNPDSSVTVLLSYVLILDVAMFVISIRRNWWELSAASTPLTWIVAAIALYGPASADITLLIFSILYFILFSLPLALVLNRNIDNQRLFIALIGAVLLNNFTFLLIGTEVIADIPTGNYMKGLIPLIAAIVNGMLYFRFYAGENDGLIRKILTGLIILFIALIFPIQFSSPDTVLSCIACYGAVLNLAYARQHNPLTGIAAAIIFVIIIFTTLTPFIELSWLNRCDSLGRAITELICATAFAASAWTINRYKTAYSGHFAIFYTILLWAGGLMALSGLDTLYDIYLDTATSSRALMVSGFIMMFILSLTTSRGGNSGWLFPGIGAIWFAYAPYSLPDGNPIFADTLLWTGAAAYIALATAEGIKGFRNRLTGPIHMPEYTVYFNIAAIIFTVAATEYLLRQLGLTHLYSAGLSIALTLCGAAQLIIGLRHHLRLMRIIGLCVVGIVLVKLAIYDLWVLPTVGRIIVFILLGIVLLVISFLYQKLRAAIFNDN